MTTTYAPETDDARVLRDAFGRFATGVTVITTRDLDRPIGITANSFASVSLDPPLVLWSPARSSRRFPIFGKAAYFAVHVLGAEQADLCGRFTKDGHDFEGLNWSEGVDGVPLLDGCIARFECKQHSTHDGGDHLVILGRVLGATFSDGAPLLFNAGQLGAFQPIT